MHDIKAFDVLDILFGKSFIGQHPADCALHGVISAVGRTLEYPVVVDYFVAGKGVGRMIEMRVGVIQTDFIHGFFHVIRDIIIAKRTDKRGMCAAQLGIDRNIQSLAAGIHHAVSQVFINHTVTDTNYFYHKFHLFYILNLFLY